MKEKNSAKQKHLSVFISNYSSHNPSWPVKSKKNVGSASPIWQGDISFALERSLEITETEKYKNIEHEKSSLLNYKLSSGIVNRELINT